MPRQLRWRNLATGFIAIAGVAALAVFILVFGRAGALHGGKFTLFITIDDARGVIRGTDVWLDGQKVGLVSDIAFQPPSIKRDERLVLKLSILNRARPHIRTDSRATVQSGTTILGDRVVALNTGTSTHPVVSDGDTIRAGMQVDLEGITSDASIAAREFPGIMQNVKLLAAQLRTAQGTLAAFGAEGASPQLARLRQRTDRVLALLDDTTGTFGLAMHGGGEPLRARTEHAMAQVDSIRALLASNEHSLGRFRRDSTLRIEIQRIRTELADVKRLLEQPNGTLGRFRSDSAFLRSVATDRAALDSLFADMKKHPIRYISF